MKLKILAGRKQALSLASDLKRKHRVKDRRYAAMVIALRLMYEKIGLAFLSQKARPIQLELIRKSQMSTIRLPFISILLAIVIEIKRFRVVRFVAVYT